MTEHTLDLPPLTRTSAGEERRVGIEIELAGFELNRLTDLVARHLGLAVEQRGRYEHALTGDTAGDWIVELDFNLLKEMGRQDPHQDPLLDEVRSTAEHWLHRAAEQVVPMELVSPPLPLSRLDEVETLMAFLREQGAKGSSDNWVNAFGLQLNSEMPALDADTLTRYMKAYLCLADWLVERVDVDLTRRLTSYIDPYPIEYVRLATDPDYQPDIARFIGDYLVANPTRNRSLDWLPVLAHIDEQRVRKAVDDTLLKPRPALHYRLPNCEIHRADWGLHSVWRDWLVVERLASNPEQLAACCKAYQKHLARNGLERWWTNWVKELEADWLGSL
ncbi:MAG: amidoligase family protein [Natronospirillum sp.]|uniref:amidoligase family protein n=1 Tax=Natronospirillum sp. TaxID=2812955 RepID=UPI0025E50725|nr:amidoligase family protein [Natronospirillum sp.]MCH8552102.1 amidoligase family protein [Natronospirillum sp.]